jgi:ATP-binding cassette, subfamily B, bacterial
MKPRPWWLRLGGFVRPQARGLTGVALLMFVGVGIDVLRPWPLKLVVDHVLGDEPWPVAAALLTDLPGGHAPAGQLLWLTLATVALFLAGSGVAMLRDYVKAGVGNRMAYDLGAAIFDHLQSLSLRYHGQRPAGDLVSRITANSTCVRDLVVRVLLPLLTSLTMVVAMFAVMYALHPALSLLALAVMPGLALLIYLFGRPMTERSYEAQRLEGERWGLAEQTLSSLPVVQAFGREEHEDGRFRELSHRTFGAHMRALASQLQFKVGVGSVTAFGTAALMGLGGFQVLQGALTLGGLLVFLTYLASLYAPLETLTYLSSGYAGAAANARRVFEVLDARDGVHDHPKATPFPHPVTGHVRIEGVTFGYEDGTPILHDIHLEAQPGDTIALVGATGVGKSTLVSLIPRFFDPWQGRITIDGTDIRTIRLASLRQHVALVLQEPFILPLTIADNIAYGRPTATRTDIIAAAEAANARDFIERLPQGFDTTVGERGSTLSGGEQQRLSIARALLKNAPILILDEPTSALDTTTETLILSALDRLVQGRTTFVIAHRLSTIRRADHIVVLEHGRIAETGTHDQLIRAHGPYHAFHTLQEPVAAGSGRSR